MLEYSSEKYLLLKNSAEGNWSVGVFIRGSGLLKNSTGESGVLEYSSEESGLLKNSAEEVNC